MDPHSFHFNGDVQVQGDVLSGVLELKFLFLK
jgi:hypothetical protein